MLHFRARVFFLNHLKLLSWQHFLETKGSEKDNILRGKNTLKLSWRPGNECREQRGLSQTLENLMNTGWVNLEVYDISVVYYTHKKKREKCVKIP